MRRSLYWVGVLVILAASMIVGCSGGDDTADMTWAGDGERDAAGAVEEAPETTIEAAATTTMAMEGEFAPAPGEESAEDAVNTAAQETAAPVDPATLGRMIVYTANLEIEVDDVIVAGEQVQTAVAGLGGVLFGQETTIGEYPYSVLTIKVPPENFQEALGRLAGIGKLLSQQVYADDVTERVVDLESRITTAEASVERLRSFLATAESVEAVAELEGQLLERETELELLRGQLRTLEAQVSLATIVLVLSEPVPPEPEPALELVQTAYMGLDGGGSCPGSDTLRLEEGEALTVCYQLTNTGDTGLADIEVWDRGLRADEDDLVVVRGSLESILQPEASVILAFETEANPRRYPDPSIEVTAVDDDGEPLWMEVEVEIETLSLRVDEDDSLPGFVDALKKAWEGMQWLFGVVVIGAGVLIPFIWIPIVLIGAYWLLRRRVTRGSKAPEPTPPASQTAPESGEEASAKTEE